MVTGGAVVVVAASVVVVVEVVVVDDEVVDELGTVVVEGGSVDVEFAIDVDGIVASEVFAEIDGGWWGGRVAVALENPPVIA